MCGPLPLVDRGLHVRLFPFVAYLLAATLLVFSRAEAVIQGIDVSHWQGPIDWNSVKAAGIQFAFVKISDGFGDYDETFPTNLNAAIAAGIPIGPYHFAYPQTGTSNPLDAANEANYFVDWIQPYYQSTGVLLRPVLDLETTSGQATVAAEKVFLSKWVSNFAAVVQSRLGVAPIIYTSGTFAKNYLDGTPPPVSIDGTQGYDIDQYPLWFAKQTVTNIYDNAIPPTTSGVNPDIGIWAGKGWKFWQWSGTGSVSGIGGNVDRNVFDGTLLELAQQFSPNYSNGDYNNNGVVDAADYVTWRNTFGMTVNAGVDADGDLSGSVDAGDFTIWKTNFGKLVPNVPTGAGAALGTVPEPATILLGFAVLVSLAMVRRR